MHHNAHLITRESFAFYDACRDSPDRFLPLDGASYLHGCVRCWVALLSFCGSPLGSGSVPFDFCVVCVGSGFIVARLFVMLLQCIVAFRHVCPGLRREPLHPQGNSQFLNATVARATPHAPLRVQRTSRIMADNCMRRRGSN